VRIGFWRSALHLGALWALAFAQPLFALLGEEAGFFVARGSLPLDIVILGLGYGLLPPLAGGALVWAAGHVHARAGLAVHAGLLGLLAAALVLPGAGDLLAGSAGAVPVALAGGAFTAVLYLRAAGVRAVFTALSPAPLVVVGLFLLVSPASELVTAGQATGSEAGPARSQTPIVQVILDELPITTVTDARGRLDERRFPNLAALARDATWYRHATTSADATLEAVPVQVTGELPKAGMLPTTRDHPRSLFTLFGRSHDLVVVEPITDVCPAHLCVEHRGAAAGRLRDLADDVRLVAGHLLLPDDLRRGLAPIDDTWSDFGEPRELPTGEAEQAQRSELGKQVGRDLKSTDSRAGFASVTAALRRPRERPPLVFMHSILPHSPWRYLPDGRRYPLPPSDPPGLEAKTWLDRQDLVDQSFQRHVLQARYADALLGRLLDELRRTGLYDRAAIVVASDHGAAFRATMRRRVLTPENLPDLAGVPLIVKAPGQREGRVSDRAVRTVDVLPTLAQAAGVRVPWKTDGMPAEQRGTDAGAVIEVRRAGGPGESAPLAEVLAWQRRRNAREDWLLRRGDYGVGPRPDLIGRRVPTEVRGRPLATVRAPAAYAHTTDAPAVVPAFVAGRLRGRDTRATLAIAVDGRVEATTTAFPEPGGPEYRALVPPSTLAGGSATLTVLEVRGNRLRPIGGTG
jgi:hypothetical protein